MTLSPTHPQDNPSKTILTKTSLQDRVLPLINSYLNPEKLHDRLADLPKQFISPRPRKWALIDWNRININQIIDIEPEIFLAILRGAIDTEAPIRGYTQTSRQYLTPLHPPMAKFVGGTIDDCGKLTSLGLWELEERRHTPALIKIYQQISGEKIQPTERRARPYQPTTSPVDDLYHHGLHRIMTEYGATCLYLWLAIHSTGTLHQVLSELIEDEVNHLTKFWGFGVWLFPGNNIQHISRNLKQLLPRKSQGSLLHTYRRMMEVLHWKDWQGCHRWELVYIFLLVIHRLWTWHQTLSHRNLDRLFGNFKHN